MILVWDIYEIRCDCATLHGVKLRGRVRKFCIDSEITCLVENASDEENVVRFGLISGTNPKPVKDFLKEIVPEALVVESLKKVPNPVLSKIKVNEVSRYG
jgi:hypothetical protein